MNAVIMEAMRNTWSDDRLDDLNLKVDRGFEAVDRRFEAVDRRFQQVESEIHSLRLETVGEFKAVRKEMNEGFRGVHRLMVQTIVALVGVLLAGFSGMLVLLAALL